MHDLLNEFLTIWDIKKVKEMKLEKYVSIGDKNTFCQWIETKTQKLGSIKGMSSIKFGIYERKNPNEKPKNYLSDDKYTWQKKYGRNKEEVFEKIKENIIKIIEFSENGQFEEIDKIEISNLFKWKIAFLYSNERLVPIYKKEILYNIAKHYNLEFNNRIRISKIQEILIAKKPCKFSIYEYMLDLIDKFDPNKKVSSQLPKRRKGTNKKNILEKEITVNYQYTYTMTQKHNKLQENLKKQLIQQYGEENVILEENYVDIKVIKNEDIFFYEVKSYAYVSDCIKEALGQILFYVYNHKSENIKKIFVVGPNEPNEDEKMYIEFIKSNLKIDFEYINISFN
ncbi:hypothetical protein AB0W31_03125 [Aliarcobacter butzleri]|uniref:hypothetical protein n=1 Tax=Aliarcobacter butzleri TaxID=28197 RepID=UPI00263C1F84|nr:hypothetical protein [Aliarcobacter butzleri]MDN5111279.1 hypothetical protein [Aliarcobacter butzleri]